jgi:hypothetical protein
VSVDLEPPAWAASEREYRRALRLEGSRLVAKGRMLIAESHRIRADASDVSGRAAAADRRATAAAFVGLRRA